MVLLAGLFVATSGNYLAPSSAFVTQSQTERKEVKVWLNTSSGVYHCPGTRWYGNTKQGKYVGECTAIQDGKSACIWEGVWLGVQIGGNHGSCFLAFSQGKYCACTD